MPATMTSDIHRFWAYSSLISCEVKLSKLAKLRLIIFEFFYESRLSIFHKWCMEVMVRAEISIGMHMKGKILNVSIKPHVNDLDLSHPQKQIQLSRAEGKMFESVTTKKDPKKRLYGDVVELFLYSLILNKQAGLALQCTIRYYINILFM